MKTLYKSALILGILLSATTQVVANEPKKISAKQAEKYCNLSAQTKYAHLAKYCNKLSSKKVTKEIIIAYNTEEDTAASFFRQEKMRVESSNFFSGWNQLETTPQIKKPTVKKQKLEIVDLTTYVPNTKVSQSTTKEQPFRRQNPAPAPPAEPIRIAREWEGASTNKNRKELKEYLSDRNNTKIDPVSTAWCAAFMNAILKDTGYEGTNSLMARSFLSYGTKVKAPEEGDIVVFKRGTSAESGHVAFFVGYEYINNKQYIKALGGNQKKSVTMALYPVERLLGIRRI
jgi:uncharacterized protein (TIGR02594 family)